MRIAVTGATGFVGRFLVARLLGSGHSVHALLHRNRLDSTGLSVNNLRWFHGAMDDLSSLAALVENCDAVVHAAFEHAPGRYRGGEGRDPARFEAVNLDATTAFFELLRQHAVKKTVFLSSRAVFDGYVAGAQGIDDNAEAKPTTLYGRIKADVERIGDSMQEIGFCSLRPTGIYANPCLPGIDKWRELITHAARASQLTGSYSDQQRTEVHVDDVALAIELLLTQQIEAVPLKHFNCSDIQVSEHQLIALVRTIVTGQSVNAEELPTGTPATNPMRCDKLHALGWRPGGMPKLIATLRESVAALT